jgi:hypothetical protein
MDRFGMHADVADRAQTADRDDDGETRFVPVLPYPPECLDPIRSLALGNGVAHVGGNRGGGPVPSVGDQVERGIIDRKAERLYLAARNGAATEFVRQAGPEGAGILADERPPDRFALGDVAADIADQADVFAPCQVGDRNVGDLLGVVRVELVDHLAIALGDFPADGGRRQQQSHVGKGHELDDIQAAHRERVLLGRSATMATQLYARTGFAEPRRPVVAGGPKSCQSFLYFPFPTARSGNGFRGSPREPGE